MAVMASWNGKTWGVSSQRIAALNGISHAIAIIALSNVFK